MTTASIPRRHDLDALRAIAMLLGIALHGVLSYMPLPAGAWPVQDVRQSESFGTLMSVIHGFRMPLFFLISGFFTAMLWRKRGLGSLLMHRFKRIFLPLLIGMFTIVPAVWVTSIWAASSAGQADKGVSSENLWLAARKGDLAQVQTLLGGGADPDQSDAVYGMTAVSMAAVQGHEELVEWMITAGAGVNSRNRDGGTPLHEAAFFGRSDTAQVLLQHGASLSARNRLGHRAVDQLNANPEVTGIRTSFLKVDTDSLRIEAGRARVARLLKQAELAADSESAAIAEPVPSRNQSSQDLRQLLVFLLILFPLFHHLWFLWFLCWLVAAFAIYAKLLDWTGWKPPAWLVVSPLRYAWLVPLTMVPQAMMGTLFPNFGPDTSIGLLPMPQILLYYAVFFFFGAMYFDCDDHQGRLGRRWTLTLPIALLVVFPIGYDMAIGAFGFSDRWLDQPWFRTGAVLLQVVYVWLMSFGLIGLFRSLLSKESRTLRYLSDSSYWLYLAHLPLIIVAQALVRNWQAPALLKFGLICVVSSALLLASYQLLVRHTPIGTLLNGPRRKVRAAEPMMVQARYRI
ncbi:MAG: acyltransferase family protein [Pirellulales bacterium]|nr:acyltransferase family protein [Pirellulales bacterium]